MSIKRLEFSHKTVFGIVMRHSELCRKTLERILDKKILRVEIPEIEKTYDYSAYSKGIRLDVYCDGEDEVYNIEMQNYKFKDLPKRGRYYQAMIDKDLLDKGESYSNLKKNIIIFICRFDLFKKGKHLYTFENRCIQHPELAYGDETQKIILNTTSKENDIPLALKMFLDYIETGEVQDEFTAELEMEVDKIRQNKKWRDEIMTYEQEWENEKDSLCRQWKEEGREEGFDLGLNQAYIKYASKMLENGSARDEVLSSLIDMFEISTEKAEEVITTASTK
ncbi:MAG: Rpn family recombination-promoting nuclease/putative transposase [Eubacterium sp.]|nr:Rpn family recombination-promoting nuclease/putative transposase [Eubacterium sp.]